MTCPALRSLVLVACLITILGALGAPPARAVCEQPALISTFETSTIYSYILTPGVYPVPGVSSSMTTEAFGSFWALGFGDPIVGEGLDNGAFTSESWLDLTLGYPAAILTSWAADGMIDGCIDEATTDQDCTAVLLTDDDGDGTSFFKMMTASETLTRDYLFNLPGNAPIVLSPIPIAELSGYDESLVTVASPTLPVEGFQLDPACGQSLPEDVVVGYRVYRYLQDSGGPVPFERMPQTDPTVLDGWRPALGGVMPDGGPLPIGTDTVIDIGCQPWDVYFAIQLVFDSGYETPYVSAASGPLVCGPCSGADEDGDGYCTGEGGTYEDCDDTDPIVFPGAPARCDGMNNDCLDPDWPLLPDDELDFDGDGFVACEDCDDDDATVFPGAPEICDGQVNRCGGQLPIDEVDEDGDGFLACEGDCAPNISTIYPGAPELCDNRNNDCDNPNWPDISGPETDDNDGDGISECDGDCWDFPTFGDAAGRDIYPGAPEICDGVANDCDDPNWPEPVVELEDDPDLDEDGFTICGGGDCDDTDPTVYPGAPEQCDGVNNDCNDPDWPDAQGEDADVDGDGFAECEGDCAELDRDTYPGAPQVCDGVNNDCDDPIWPELPANERDNDLDDFLACEECDDSNGTVFPGATERCDGVANDCNDPNWPEVGGFEMDGDGDGFIFCQECSDSNADVYPGAPQVCDGVNNDCNDPAWPSLAGTNEADPDGDGFSECTGDCDQGRPTVYPGAPQLCDGINNDCNDPGWPEVPPDEVDADGDGAPSCADCDDGDARVFPGAPQLCDGVNNDCNDPSWPDLGAFELDGDGDGFVACAECDDAAPNVFPGAPQVCDGVNNDCDDPNWPSLDGTNERDLDDDGIGECQGDCDNSDPTVFPGAPQICDGVNNDCDDPNWPVPPADEQDGDGDGFPVCGDCDDANALTYPGAPQVCDGINNDCLDPNWPEVERVELDLDGDGFPLCVECDDGDATTYPDAPQICDDFRNNDCRDPNWPELTGTNEDDIDGDGITECNGDCAPLDGVVFPGAPQVCDGVNNDCDDPSWPALPADEADGDGDDFPACADCDDADGSVFPGAPQFCDGVNNDCDDPSWPAVPANERDDDADGFPACGECDDSEATVYPGAPEICDGLNNDCDNPDWPTPPNEDADADGDGLSSCDGDCNDNDGATFPGALQVCDGVNNDCDDPNWPAVPEDEVDGDGDASPACADCDDADPRIFPNAPQACDGINNDCLDPSFPGLEGTNEFDDDGDGFTECAGDCADDDALRNPGVEEDCENGIDDDCDGLIDFFDMEDCRDLFVALESFTATAGPGGVALRWTTSQEIDSAGFRVLRSGGGRRTETITLRPIPSKGDVLHGADYEFLDTDRQSIDDLRYWLEEIDVFGEVTRYGPIKVDPPAAAAPGGRRGR